MTNKGQKESYFLESDILITNTKLILEEVLSGLSDVLECYGNENEDESVAELIQENPHYEDVFDADICIVKWLNELSEFDKEYTLERKKHTKESAYEDATKVTKYYRKFCGSFNGEEYEAKPKAFIDGSAYLQSIIKENQSFQTILRYELQGYLRTRRKYKKLLGDKSNLFNSYNSHMKHVEYFRQLGLEDHHTESLEKLFYTAFPDYHDFFSNPEVEYFPDLFQFELKAGSPSLPNNVASFWFYKNIASLIYHVLGSTWAIANTLTACLSYVVGDDTGAESIRGERKETPSDLMVVYQKHIWGAMIELINCDDGHIISKHLNANIEEIRGKLLDRKLSEYYQIFPAGGELEDWQLEILENEDKKTFEQQAVINSYKAPRQKESIKAIYNNLRRLSEKKK